MDQTASSADDNFFGARFILGDSLQNLLYLARRVSVCLREHRDRTELAVWVRD